jgi:lysine-N-methylase
MKLLQPGYFDAFRCIGAACEDTCCTGWIVHIDRSTYGKYQSCTDPEIGPALHALVTINESSSNDNDYAKATLNGSACAFLSEGLCSIQRRLGEEYLSKMCATYPRVVNRVDDVVQRSLDLSCPEAARLVLLNSDPIKFVEREDGGASAPAEVDISALRDSPEPYREFRAMRRRAISLLQDRSYPIEARLRMLGDLTPGTSPDPAAEVEILSDLLVARLTSDPCPRRFLECYQEFISGLQWTGESTMGEIGSRYNEACWRYYAPFMNRHEHILENYLVSYVHRTLFPLGVAESNQRLRNIPGASQYALLVAHYALVKGLLIGMAGFHRSGFDASHVVKLIQSCAKTFEHSVTFPARAVEILAGENLSVMIAAD